MLRGHRFAMKRRMTLWVQLAFLAVFLLVAGALLFVRVPEMGQPADSAAKAAGADPKSICEARGDWWDDMDKTCAVPMPVAKITGHN